MTFIDNDWSAKSVLIKIAQAAKYHSLIDTGALVTGFSNYEVARLLLSNGLEGIKAVVYLDENDDKKVLLRESWRVSLSGAACSVFFGGQHIKH